MKNKIYIILIIVFAFCSCNDYEEVPVEKHTKEYVFSPTDSLGNDAKRYLLSVYKKLEKLKGHNRVGGDYLDAATDDAVSASTSVSDVQRLQVGQYTPSQRITSDMMWGDFYEGIRRANTFINNVDVVPFMERVNNHVETGIPLNRTLKAEARFLKALYYFELVKRYGGIPLVGDTPWELGEDMVLPRNTFDECITYIVDELNAVKDSLRSADNLTEENLRTYGHVPTAGAAMALKAKVLLYAASPLFNGNTIETNNALVGYTDYKADRWEKAAQAADEFITMWGPSGRSAYDLMDDFRDAFLGYYPNNREIIFHVQMGNGNKDVESTNGPIGFSGNSIGRGATSPSHNLVAAFPMKDGKPMEESVYYTPDPQKMYENRDPRFYYTVLYNGAKWLLQSLETFENGKSNPRSTTMQKTKTGYYMRKFMGKFEEASEYSGSTRNWPILRYAEMLLDYAEAQNEFDLASGRTTVNVKVMQAIRDLRKRAGVEEGAATQYGIDNSITCTEMRDLIRNERRIEMAFEEHRYWDIRRWRIAEEIFKVPAAGEISPVTGVVILKRAGQLEPPREISVVNLTENFMPYRNLYPLPYTEVIKNNNMVQNPGWTK
jgi:hypothetical protein